MKKTRRSLMALGVAVFSLSAILTGRMKEKPVLAQLNCQKAVPITSRWADDTHIFSSFDDQKALSVPKNSLGAETRAHFRLIQELLRHTIGEYDT